MPFTRVDLDINPTPCSEADLLDNFRRTVEEIDKVQDAIEDALADVADEKAKVSSNDTTAGYLNGKLLAGDNIDFTENDNGSDETLTIAAPFVGFKTYADVPAGGLPYNTTIVTVPIADPTTPGSLNRVIPSGVPGWTYDAVNDRFTCVVPGHYLIAYQATCFGPAEYQEITAGSLPLTLGPIGTVERFSTRIRIYRIRSAVTTSIDGVTFAQLGLESGADGFLTAAAFDVWYEAEVGDHIYFTVVCTGGGGLGDGYLWDAGISFRKIND